MTPLFSLVLPCYLSRSLAVRYYLHRRPSLCSWLVPVVLLYTLTLYTFDTLLSKKNRAKTRCAGMACYFLLLLLLFSLVLTCITKGPLVKLARNRYLERVLYSTGDLHLFIDS